MIFVTVDLFRLTRAGIFQFSLPALLSLGLGAVKLRNTLNPEMEA